MENEEEKINFYKERLIPLYGILNNYLSANYACINRVHQMCENNFSKPILSLLTDCEQEDRDLLSEFARIRNNQLYDFKESLSFAPSQEELYEEYESNKNILMRAYNKFFGQEFSYDDCFDGLVIKNPWFNSVIKQCNEVGYINANSSDLVELIRAYWNFANYIIAFYTNRSFYEIMEQVEYDVSSQGYPTPYYNHPISENVTLMSKAEIKSLVKLSRKKYIDTKTKEQVAKKHLERVKNEYYSDKKPKNLEAVGRLDKEHCKWQNHAVDAEHLYILCMELEKRLKFAGKLPYKPTLAHTLRFNLNPLEVNETYVHNFEKLHVKYLCDCLGLQDPFLSQTKQPEQ